MFTGIVQEVGEIRECTPIGKALRFSFAAPVLADKLQVGDSVACDGVCLTVERVTPTGFSVTAVQETLQKTTLGQLKIGDGVNLETALLPQTPMGGHFVLGHVDGVCEVIGVTNPGPGQGRELTLRLPEEFMGYCVYKGSLTVSGVSLTIAAVEHDSIRLAIIPHTLEMTNLARVRPMSRLNFEVDILAKYVERLLSARLSLNAREPSLSSDPRASGISSAVLEKWGYGIQ